ncbi:MAG: hypothetical protein ACO3JL_11485 [Myxococcota bacterium]
MALPRDDGVGGVVGKGASKGQAYDVTSSTGAAAATSLHRCIVPPGTA